MEKVHSSNPLIYVYDTSGAYSDKNQQVDITQGLPRIKSQWIKDRRYPEARKVLL